MAIEKKVRFHKADPAPVNLDLLHHRLEAVAQAGAAEMPMSLGQRLVGQALASRPGDVGVHFVMYRIQTEDLPFLRDPATGTFRPLEDVLDQAPELAQPTYYAFFPDNTMAFVYNHQGPKEAQLGSYLHWLDPHHLDHTFPPVTRDDVIQAIQQSGGVRLLNIRVPTDQLARLDDIRSLAGMKAVANRLPVADVEIIVRASTDDQRRGLGEVVSQIGEALLSPGRRSAVKKARIELSDLDGVSGMSDLDLLVDRLVVSHPIDTIEGNRKYLDETSARDGIEIAYQKVGQFIH
ncbi:MAG: hypothetical protein ABSB09_00805 [Acidimicrobiales bacterium]|jgi:hypothetical protein